MAKRFIDTEIWKKKWFRELNPAQKSFYFYLISNCDYAGIYEVDFDAAKFFIGGDIELNIENIKASLSEELEIHEISDKKWLILGFLKLQYPAGLNSVKPVIVSIRKRLSDLQLSIIVNKRFGNDFLTIEKPLNNNSLTIKEKDKDSEKDKIEDIEKKENKDKEKNKELLKDKEQIKFTGTENYEKSIDKGFNEKEFLSRVFKEDYKISG